MLRNASRPTKRRVIGHGSEGGLASAGRKIRGKPKIVLRVSFLGPHSARLFCKRRVLDALVGLKTLTTITRLQR